MLLKLILIVLFFSQLLQIFEAGGGEHKAPISTSNKTRKSIYLPLIDYLKDGYNKLAVPVCDDKTKFHVFMDIWLYQLFNLNEPTQLLTIDVWLEMSWYDCILTWDPKLFNGIDQVELPASEIYHPDIMWYQSIHINTEEGIYLFPHSVAKIRSNGMVQLGVQGLLKSFCRIDISQYPYDTQKCNLTFASWSRDASVFNLTKKDVEGSKGHSFKTASNGEWEVIEFPAFNSITSYKFGSDESGNGSLYAEVIFQLTLQRKPRFIKIYLIFPCVLLLWIASITFFLPIDSGSRIDMSVTLLLSVTFFLLLVSENIPRTSDSIPTLGLFFCMATGLVCLSVLMTAIVINIEDTCNKTKMSKGLKNLLTNKFLCLHTTSTKLKVKDGEINHWILLATLLNRIFLIMYLGLAYLATSFIYFKETEMKQTLAHDSGH